VRQVEVTKLGRSRLIIPVGQSWDAFFEGPRVSDDFMEVRRQPKAAKREQF
jgi:antitoxin VapB